LQLPSPFSLCAGTGSHLALPRKRLPGSLSLAGGILASFVAFALFTFLLACWFCRIILDYPLFVKWLGGEAVGVSDHVWTIEEIVELIE
jgi:hypothetical protein